MGYLSRDRKSGRKYYSWTADLAAQAAAAIAESAYDDLPSTESVNINTTKGKRVCCRSCEGKGYAHGNHKKTIRSHRLAF